MDRDIIPCVFVVGPKNRHHIVSTLLWVVSSNPYKPSLSPGGRPFVKVWELAKHNCLHYHKDVIDKKDLEVIKDLCTEDQLIVSKSGEEASFIYNPLQLIVVECAELPQELMNPWQVHEDRVRILFTARS